MLCYYTTSKCTKCKKRDKLIGVLTGENHILHALLPPTSAVSQRYNIRQGPHLLQLPEHMTQLSDCSFLIRMLYKDTY